MCVFLFRITITNERWHNDVTFSLTWWYVSNYTPLWSFLIRRPVRTNTAQWLMASKTLEITGCLQCYFVFFGPFNVDKSTKGVLPQERASLRPLRHEYQRRHIVWRFHNSPSVPLHSSHECSEAPEGLTLSAPAEIKKSPASSTEYVANLRIYTGWQAAAQDWLLIVLKFKSTLNQIPTVHVAEKQLSSAWRKTVTHKRPAVKDECDSAADANCFLKSDRFRATSICSDDK